MTDVVQQGSRIDSRQQSKTTPSVVLDGVICRSCSKVLRALGIELVELSPADDAAGPADTIRLVADLGHGVLIVDPSRPASERLVQALRLERRRNQVIGLAPARTTGFNAAWLVDVWNGQLADLLESCAQPRFVCPDKLSRCCRPFLERCLRHDLPKLVPSDPPSDPSDLELVVERLVASGRLLGRQARYYLDLFPNSAEGFRSLAELVWRR